MKYTRYLDIEYEAAFYPRHDSSSGEEKPRNHGFLGGFPIVF